MAKQTDIRPKITLACVECKERNYITRKNRRNDPDRLELKKYCPRDRATPCTARPANPRLAWPIDPSYAGRTYPPTEPYEVGVEKIREFAAALGDDNPARRTPWSASRRAGHQRRCRRRPDRYDAEPHPRTANWRPTGTPGARAPRRGRGRRAAGVGRVSGMQVMAVHAGGRLDQHTPDLVGHDEHSPGGDVFGAVAVSTEAGSRLRRWSGRRSP